MRQEGVGYWRLVLLVLAVLLVLGACSSPSSTLLPSEAAPLLTDVDIDAAELELAESEEVLTPTDAGTVPDGEEVDLSEVDEELSSQAVLSGVSGYIAYIRNDPNNSNPWQLWLANQSNDKRTQVYAGKRQINSVAVSLDGNSVVFAMKVRPKSSNYEVYRLTVSSKGLKRLTNTSASEWGVSMSANGRTLVWSDSFEVRDRWGDDIWVTRILLRNYNASLSSFTQRVIKRFEDWGEGPWLQGLSVSGDGNYIAYALNFDDYGAAVYLYNKLANSRVEVTYSERNDLGSPSVSSGGTKVAWVAYLNALDYSYKGDEIRVKEISTGKVTKALATGKNGIRHSHMTADGKFLTYSRLQNGSYNIWTRNISTGKAARAVSSSKPINNYGPHWQK